ncbi:MAG: aspartate carbamoyltransferase [Ignavibacteriae bacterium]|nr:aspartate carbamoyltransferase [Ignavibacteriota bacterium]
MAKSQIKNYQDLKKLSWDEFHNTPMINKLKHFEKDGHLFDCLFSQQFTPKIIDTLFNTADKIRKIAKNKEGLDWLQTLLSHKRAMLYFVQPSTRTFVSFQSACHILGMKVSEIRSTSTSSELKGESAEDTIRTFSSYADMIIMRHFEEGMAEKAAWMLNKTKRPISVVNGGSGKDQHPTQALLDLYTLFLSFSKTGGIQNKTIVMAGDLRRGRTVRSLTYLLKHYKGIRLIYVSPEYLGIGDDIKSFLKKHKMPYEETANLTKSLRLADAVYMTRIQDEYDINNESKEIDYSKFHLTKEHLKIMKKSAIIMHPLPRRQEIETAVDDDPRAMYWRQERNGMWIRTALIAYLFGSDKVILDA